MSDGVIRSHLGGCENRALLGPVLEQVGGLLLYYRLKAGQVARLKMGWSKCR